MSALASLVRAYDRLYERGEAPAFGYARTNVRFCVVLRPDGTPAFAPISFEQGVTLDLPTPLIQRTSEIAPNFLWDKTAYALAITQQSKRSSKEHDAFIKFHEEALKGTTDAGLRAFLEFLRNWKPSEFDSLGWPEDMKDKNIVFALQDEYRQRYLHQRTEAIERWHGVMTQELASVGQCLLTGTIGRIARSHPPIKGVRDAQSSGAYIVSFNQSAFKSYSHEQGDNAPVCETAAFAYTAILNRFLEKGSGNKIQIGDASTVFWADASDPQKVAEAEEIFADLFGVDPDKQQKSSEDAGSRAISVILAKIRSGRPIQEIKRDLPQGRFYILGLSPNAARLSIRFYFEDDFGHLIGNVSQHASDLRIEPDFSGMALSARALLNETCIHVAKEGPGGHIIWRRAREAIPPMTLCGEFMRSILLGTKYPSSLLARITERIRAEGGRVTYARAAICRATINRNARLSHRMEEVPMALDREYANPAYRLGRVFALMEKAQKLAIPNVKATIRDKFYASASSSPARVFPLLISGTMHHLSAAQKGEKHKRLAFWLEQEIGEAWAALKPDLPRTLRLEDQGRFHIGYFHQRYGREDAKGAQNPVAEEPANADETNQNEEGSQ